MQKSSEKENKKVQTDKQFKDNPVREGQGDYSIYNEDNTESTNFDKQAANKELTREDVQTDRNDYTKSEN